MMNKEAKARWLKALRSGRYKQATSRLKYDKSYCCLGVLCRVEKFGKFKLKSLNNIYNDKHYVLIFDNNQMVEGTLPENFRKNLRISGLEQDVLIKQNDSGSNFKEIADWIEKNL